MINLDDLKQKYKNEHDPLNKDHEIILYLIKRLQFVEGRNHDYALKIYNIKELINY